MNKPVLTAEGICLEYVSIFRTQRFCIKDIEF